MVNLRAVTKAENMKNKRMMKNNTSGATGVGFHKWMKKWVANVGVNGDLIHLGYFKTKEEAITVRKAAEIKYGFHENHGKAILQ